MAKNDGRARRRRGASGHDAFTPLLPRSDSPALSIDPSRRLDAAELARVVRAHGLELAPWMEALETSAGGVTFGAGYQAVHLGFRHATSTSTRTGDGRPLLRIGVEGDTHYFVTNDCEAWAQDGIADRHPHREAASFRELAEKLRWPEALRSRL